MSETSVIWLCSVAVFCH